MFEKVESEVVKSEVVDEDFSLLKNLTIKDLVTLVKRSEEPIIFEYNKYNYCQVWHNLEKQIHREDGPAFIETKKDGTVVRECWYINGKLHRENEPAIIKYYTESIHKFWYLNGINYNPNGPSTEMRNLKCDLINESYTDKEGKLHREDGAASVEYNYGYLKKVQYCINGKLHRIGGPAVIIYHGLLSRQISREEYHVNGELHREEGPAITCYDADHKKYSEEYYFRGEFHNFSGHDDSPHHQGYNREGFLIIEKWFDSDRKLHRENGPALIQYTGTKEFPDRKTSSSWYNHGKLTKEAKYSY